MGHPLPDFGDEFDFDGGAQGEAGCADGGAGVFASVAEDFSEEVAGAVGDFRLVGEVGRGVDEDADADDARDVVDTADDAGYSGEGVECGDGGTFGGLFERDFGGHAAGDDELAFLEGDLAGSVDVVAGADGGDVVGHGFGDLRQGESEFGEFLAGGHRKNLPCMNEERESATPLGLKLIKLLPGVAAAQQPWAEIRNAVGVEIVTQSDRLLEFTDRLWSNHHFLYAQTPLQHSSALRAEGT